MRLHMALRCFKDPTTFRVKNEAPPQRASHWAQQARFEAGIETCYIHRTQQFWKSIRNHVNSCQFMSYTLAERTGRKKDGDDITSETITTRNTMITTYHNPNHNIPQLLPPVAT